MLRTALQYRRVICSAALGVLSAAACKPSDDSPPLGRNETHQIPDVPVPPADGPRLGAIAHTTPVREAPYEDATIIGYLHAGATVARAVEAYSNDGCTEGWYPIRPRGFVCVDEGATLDLQHPTLLAMAIAPNLGADMPYAYARTKTDATVYEVDEEAERRVRAKRSMTSKSGAAIVGSWQASDENGKELELAMLTNGSFVDVSVLDRAEYSAFKGVELRGATQLPVGFIVKRGISAWDITGPTLKRKRRLDVHEVLPLTGKFRTSHNEKFWETVDGDWVRHRDMTTARQRSKMPAFVNDGRRWLDVSIVTGTAVAYEGEEPVYATLLSVGADRLGEQVQEGRVTERGEFAVVSKHITALNAKPEGFANRVEMHDVPWVLELASGQLLHGAYWHKRFGVEHGPGNLQLSPADAHWIWQWAGPSVPEGWHAVLELPSDETATIVNIRK
jgi:hypothetical protein